MTMIPEIEKIEVSSRAGYKSRVVCVPPGLSSTCAGEVSPSLLRFSRLLGMRGLEGGGCWLNLEFQYRKPGGMTYVLEAACSFTPEARFTGQSFVRSCSCPDGEARARKGAKGAARMCKHMVALAARVAASALHECPMAGLPKEAAPRAQKKRDQAQQLAAGWSSGEWDPAGGWLSEPAPTSARAQALLAASDSIAA